MAGLLAHRWQLVPTAHLPRLYRLVVLRAVLLCLQWRDRAGFAPSFPFKPRQGHHRSIPLYHGDSAHSYGGRGVSTVFEPLRSKTSVSKPSGENPGSRPKQHLHFNSSGPEPPHQRHRKFRRNLIEIRQQMAQHSDDNFPGARLKSGGSLAGETVRWSARLCQDTSCGDPWSHDECSQAAPGDTLEL
jgi:hypothetical protein